MDRDLRKESRKRGAASREFTTGDVVIKTPKRRRSWVPVSQDAGALITEELSNQFSPELRLNDYTSQDHRYPEDNHTIGPDDDDDIEPFDEIKHQTPQTPLERIGFENPEEPQTHESNRSYVSIKTPAVETTRQNPKSVNKSLNKQTPKSTRPKKKDKIFVKQVKKAYKRQIDESKFEQINIQNIDIPENVKASRLRTSSARLTAIDVLAHYLRSLIPDSTHFKKFHELNKEYLNNVLDLNLINNDLIDKLKETKLVKQNLRNQLFEIKNEINSNTKKVEKMRMKYQKLKAKILLKRQINKEFKKLEDDDNDNESKLQNFNPSQLIEDLNHLNNTLDPNWGLIDKLKALNQKLYKIDEQL